MKRRVPETCDRCGGWVWHRQEPCTCKPQPLPSGDHKQLILAIGCRVQMMRRLRNFSLDALADIAGISKTGLWQIEMGKSEPMASTLLRLAMALDTTTDYLLLHDLT